MHTLLNLAQREACEAVWRAIDERREIALGIAYNPQTDCLANTRHLVATTVQLLDAAQLRRLVEPEIERYGQVRRDFAWRWSSVLDEKDAAWPT